MCTIECTPSLSPLIDRDPVFCFRKANFDLIRGHLNTIDFGDIVLNSIDVDGMVVAFYDVIYDIFERFVPKSSLRSSNKPRWHDRELTQLKKKPQ